MTKYGIGKAMAYCPKCKKYKFKRTIKKNNYKCPDCGYDFHKDVKEVSLK